MQNKSVGGMLKGLRFKIGTTFVLLLGAGMLLINIVLTMFWQRDMVRLENERHRMAMAVSAGYIDAGNDDIESALHRLAVHTEAECALYQPPQGEPLILSGDCKYRGQMSHVARLAISTGKMQTTRDNPGSHFLSIAGRFALIAMPLNQEGVKSGALALAVPLQPLAKQLISNQKAVLLYILINLLILTVVGLVRMVKVVIRPIERLAQMSEAYTEDDGFNFMTIRGDDEFRRLSMSINHMLQRIEADRNKLKVTVGSLKKANQQLRDTQQEMVRSEKLASVGRLAAGLAHEIGNPVGIVQGYLDLIGQVDVSPTEKKDYLNRADKELQRIGGLIRKLLDYSRSDGRVSGPVSVHPLLIESIDMFNLRSGREALEIVQQFNAEKDTVFADPDQLRQVFLNCLLNALDALSGSTRENKNIAVTTEMLVSEHDKAMGHWIRVRIEDNGSGISESNLPKVFDPFFTTREPGKGTGLGLFVSHTIIENLGGRMRIESAGQSGTEVIIELPLKGESDSAWLVAHKRERKKSDGINGQRT